MAGPTVRPIGDEDHNSHGEGTLRGENGFLSDISSVESTAQSRVQIMISTGPTTYLGVVSVETEPPAGNGRAAGTSGTVPNFAALQESFEAVNTDRPVETIRIVNI
ncbi:hypothetical protein E8E13_002990 [Curvularia kusanoi]|uniref:Uncharacterized protein n=1 Tax=Curvularia kusanoi TaxID=90978 RepID=A0A9P4TBR7_CURKU|nr:hypothetical protein E8E13_002990 [Curvularia kusanoi]